MRAPVNVGRRRSLPGLLLFLALLSAPLAAQDDAAAGLFSTAHQLPLVAQSMSLRLEGGDAVVELVQLFANDGAELAQADYRLHLPAEATVTGFGFWRPDGRFLAAELKERAEAEATHRVAAEEGRATGLLRQDASVRSFSVYPVPAHARQQVSVTFRLPIATERGRSHVRLPLDELLAGSPLSCTIFALLRTREPLATFGVDGASFLVRGRGPNWVRLALASEQPVEIWWSEEGPPLLTRAEAVPLEDGSFALGLRVQLNDGSAWRVRPRDVVLLVDGSFSMRRRRAAVVDLLRRLAEVAPGRVRVVAVGDDTAEIPVGDPVALLAALGTADVGFHTSWDELERAARAAGCPEVDPLAPTKERRGPLCVAVTDPQVDELPPPTERRLEALFLADADELAAYGEALGESAVAYQPDVDPRGKLLAFADTLALPVLELRGVEQRGGTLERVGPPERPVAEGGLLRLFAKTSSTEPVALGLTVDGHELPRVVTVDVLDATSEAGRAVRRGYYATLLGEWMAQYRRERDPELRERIVATSVAEGIPTDLTALQVDDPAAEMAATATPGPLLLRTGLLTSLLGWWLLRRARRGL
jgi:hypothetical protein